MLSSLKSPIASLRPISSSVICFCVLTLCSLCNWSLFAAILFGDLDRVFVGVLQLMFLGALILVRRSAELGAWSIVGIALAAIFFLYQQYLIRDRDSKLCFIAFRNNATLGMCVFVSILLDYIFSG